MAAESQNSDDNDYSLDEANPFDIPDDEEDLCDDWMGNYRGIHLMERGNGQAAIGEDGVDKYQCPETGAHFEYLDMVSRLKRMQSRR